MGRISRLMITVMTILAICFLTTTSNADPINVGDTIYLSTIVSGFNGGPFGVKTSPSGSILFITFCLETDEYFYPNQPYRVNNISDVAIAGGSNTNSGDPLDPRTAYLYTMFRYGTLPIDYNNSNDLIALQRAIWLIEEEISSTTDTKANDLVALANKSGWTTIGDVRVINLGVNGLNQDQLVMVPEPSTLLLMGAGLIGFGIFGRKRFKRKEKI